MDINSFYQQAKAWQMEKEETERLAEIKRREELEAAWEKAKKLVRDTFPIAGAKYYATRPDQFDNFPITNGNYQFDVVLPGAEYTPCYDEERDMKGVIRVIVKCIATSSFEATGFYVWSSGSREHYTSHYEAFLAACNEISYQPASSK